MEADLTGMPLESRIKFHQRRVLVAESYEAVVKNESTENNEMDEEVRRVREFVSGSAAEVVRLTEDAVKCLSKTRTQYTQALSKSLAANRQTSKEIETLEAKLVALRKQKEDNEKYFSPEISDILLVQKKQKKTLSDLVLQYRKTVEDNGLDFDIAIEFLPTEVKSTKAAKEYKESSIRHWFTTTRLWKDWKQFFQDNGVLILSDNSGKQDYDTLNGDSAREAYNSLLKTYL